MISAAILLPTAPHLRLIANMTTDDPRDPETLAPETERGEELPVIPRAPNMPTRTVKTEPPRSMTHAEQEAEALAIREADVRLSNAVPVLDKDGLVVKPATMQELLYNQLMRAHEDNKKRDFDLLDPNGKFAALSREREERIKLETITGLSQAVEQIAGGPIRDLSSRIGTIANELKANAAHDKRQDDLISQMMGEIEELKAQLKAMGRHPSYPQELINIKDALTDLKLRFDNVMVARNTPKSPAETPLLGTTVLMVEDSPELSQTLTRIMRARGAIVWTADSRQAAETVIAAGGIEKGLVPDVAIIDIRLGADDGFEVAEMLVNKHGLARERILLMTGDATPAHRARALSVRFRLLDKPFGDGGIVGAIQEVLGATEPPEATPG
jgi:CheY-like chemotaxis protein